MKTNKLFLLSSYLKQPAARLVLQTIEKLGHLSRTQLAAITGLSPASITHICDHLISSGILQEAGRGAAYLGRKPVYLETNPAAGFTVVLELRPGEVDLYLMDFCANVHSRCSVRVPSGELSPELLSSLVRARIPAASLSSCFCFCIANNLDSAGLPAQDYVAFLASEFSLPVYYEMGINLTALAEAFFHFSDDRPNALYLQIGTSIRMSLVTDGVISPLMSHSPPAIGRMIETYEADGLPVTLDDTASLRYLTRQAVKSHLSQPEQYFPALAQSPLGQIAARDVVNLAGRGDGEAQAILGRYGRQLSRLLHNVVCLYNPDTIILGGEATVYMERILEASAIRDLCPFPGVKLHLAHYGGVSVAKGGAKHSISRLLAGDL